MNKIITIFLILISFSFADMKIQGNGKVKLSDSKVKLEGGLNNSATFSHENSATFNLTGDWNNTGTFSSGDGNVYFSGSFNQIITNPTGSNFNNLIVIKSSNSINLANSNSITIDGFLAFESATQGQINTRDNALVYVSSSNITRAGEGFVDGPLALYFNSGDEPQRTFVIGNGEDYTPVLIDLNLEGADNGSAGYLMMSSNDRTVEMLGSQIDESLNVERQYEMADNIDPNFDLGTRTFSMVINYINPDDLRNGANSNTFETARYRGSNDLWASFLLPVGNRTANSVESFNSFSSGTFVVGPEDFFLEMYTRESGNFDDPNNWSLYGYGLRASGFAPRNRDIPFIGDGDRIDLNNDITILQNRTLTVEQAGPTGESGTFLMGENTLSGTGTFTLNSGGWLGFGDPSGLTLAANDGNIQTAVRNYNPANHNNASFVWTGSASSTVGNGFPESIANFYVEGSDEVFLLQSTNVSNDLLINSGILDIEEYNVTGTNSGTFLIADNARLRIGGTNNLQTSLDGFNNYSVDENSYIVFNGTDQTVSEFPANFDTNLGYGNMIARASGTKLVSSNMQIRGNLYIQESAFFENAVGVTDLRVLRNVENQNSRLINYGKIILGN